MYSLVLLSAMMPGADVAPAPAPAPTVVATGCCGVVSTGCYGSCFGSCYGSCYGSCIGTGCHGSCHGGIFGWRNGGGLFGHRHSCHGCSGYSCSGYNCFGSCHGSCVGTGCHGSCIGGGCHGACYGGGVSAVPAVAMPAYTLGGYGPTVAYTDPLAVYGRVTNLNAVPAAEPKPMTPPAPLPEPKKLGANIKFQVPADAKLYVDGKLTVLTGAERAFSTPELVVGEKFYYDVKAELVVDGKPVVERKRVVVEAGANITESFPTLFAAIRSKIEVAGK